MNEPIKEPEVKKKKVKPIPKFNDHANCKGHANFMLDCTYEEQEDRNLLIGIIDRYYPPAKKVTA